eukprot:TRINITY_DN4937_c0_g1_i2.p2 TRINITY_DN4937_c0_g1~~TRINITY_DN4937_c0_g1_i2.p2  ORF type:complete len:258 (+),score=17.90 TRINITY_DN4937_c0_g1_i2:161-934(+)
MSGKGDQVVQKEQDSDDLFRVPKVFFASGLAGAVSRTATAPIDRLRMLLIVQEGRRPLTLYEGLKKMAAEGSIRSYFKGNTANVIKIAPEMAIKLTAADLLKNSIAQDPTRVQVHERFISGALGGAISQFTIYPLEVIRTRLATCTEKKASSILEAGKIVYREKGISGFYRRLAPAMLGMLPYAGTKAGEHTKRWLPRIIQKINPQYGQTRASLGQIVICILQKKIRIILEIASNVRQLIVIVRIGVKTSCWLKQTC